MKRLREIIETKNPTRRHAAERCVQKRIDRRELMNNGLSFDEACAVVNTRKY